MMQPLIQQGFGPAMCSQKLHLVKYNTKRPITGSDANPIRLILTEPKEKITVNVYQTMPYTR